jgi:hypothetical protein
MGFFVAVYLIAFVHDYISVLLQPRDKLQIKKVGMFNSHLPQVQLIMQSILSLQERYKSVAMILQYHSNSFKTV